MNPAVFLDRDGIINEDFGYVYQYDDFQWIPGAIDAIKLLNSLGYLVIIITNQSGIARGYYLESHVQALHQQINKDLQASQATIDAFYYCPHHPEAKVRFYRRNCDCRKPMPGLILQGIEQFEIDKSRSFLIGDKESDVEAAKNAGIQGYQFLDGNLYSFVLRILEKRRTEHV
ncbi:D-glycero-beta-D-manno-heptose 1,7-bisphosphate 7-phosphatase [Evansella sp. AB-P1]|uniref:D-glycero-beta-D-manno-heptose 1,7-bisphosphate 7-phosphatase n=1 Tax=Evansella sp. AB-P1 TaxID=3037653 RepID=UPI00241C721C|nr:D-glycero-beta-D-manno-heptose 1,7-bisphosphate 7-phosphatase [Evansella sp. AB-P1]MDG5788355.1 D-glycero-beta-D-manno-heptose 1,7-bisphosphate 7-phosphatase [Evansella sp. AB-P1]